MREHLPKTWPAGPTLELGSRVEQGIGAGCTDKGAAAVLLEKGAGERPLSRTLTEHCITLRSENPLPLNWRMGDGKARRKGSGTLSTQEKRADAGGASKTKECTPLELYRLHRLIPGTLEPVVFLQH